MPALGDCYEAAAKYMMDHGTQWAFASSADQNPDLVLVHAEVKGQGQIEGLFFGHAWVEDGDTVIDVSNGRNIRMPKPLYYALGGLYHKPMPRGGVKQSGRKGEPVFDLPYRREPNWHRYTEEEMAINMVRHKHYGPWDLKTSSGV